jgi:hypothetical protein
MLVAAVLNAIPIVMIYLTRVLRPRVNRWGKLIILYAWRWRNLPQLGARARSCAHQRALPKRAGLIKIGHEELGVTEGLDRAQGKDDLLAVLLGRRAQGIKPERRHLAWVQADAPIYLTRTGTHIHESRLGVRAPRMTPEQIRITGLIQAPYLRIIATLVANLRRTTRVRRMLCSYVELKRRSRSWPTTMTGR